MTTNQTIDGVPRSDLELFLVYGTLTEESREAGDRLCALLDAKPDYPECSDNPASCPENEGFGCCKDIPSSPAPYGWHVVWAESGDSYVFTQAERQIEILRLDTDVRVIPLYADQPAPVAVVSPENERLMETIEQYPNVDPLEYDAAVRKLRK